MCKVVTSGAPFTIRSEEKQGAIDMQRILEKAIAGIVTALIIGFGSWFMFINDMKNTQQDIQHEQEIVSLQLAESIRANEKDHQAIIKTHGAAMDSISEDLGEIKQTLEVFREDFYIPNNGRN